MQNVINGSSQSKIMNYRFQRNNNANNNESHIINNRKQDNNPNFTKESRIEQQENEAAGENEIGEKE